MTPHQVATLAVPMPVNALVAADRLRVFGGPSGVLTLFAPATSVLACNVSPDAAGHGRVTLLRP
jgi:hypothetical protein